MTSGFKQRHGQALAEYNAQVREYALAHAKKTWVTAVLGFMVGRILGLLAGERHLPLWADQLITLGMVGAATVFAYFIYLRYMKWKEPT